MKIPTPANDNEWTREDEANLEIRVSGIEQLANVLIDGRIPTVMRLLMNSVEFSGSSESIDRQIDSFRKESANDDLGAARDNARRVLRQLHRGNHDEKI